MRISLEAYGKWVTAFRRNKMPPDCPHTCTYLTDQTLSANPDNHSTKLHHSENLKSQIQLRAPIIVRKKILISWVEIDSLIVISPCTDGKVNRARV